MMSNTMSFLCIFRHQMNMISRKMTRKVEPMLAPTATATFCLFHFPEMLENFQSIIALHIKKKSGTFIYLLERERGGNTL